QGNHDRIIEVRLEWDAKKNEIVVLVKYRLEVGEDTVLFDDLKPFKDELDFRLKELKFYSQFTTLYAPIFARNLTAHANGKPLTFKCEKHAPALEDEKGQALGHLRCEFVFRAAFAPRMDRDNIFTFKEDNYQLQKGKIDLSFIGAEGIKIKNKTEPDAALKARPEKDYLPGDEDKLRQASATFTVSPGTKSTVAPPVLPAPKNE